MIEIFATHGVVDRYQSGVFCHRNLLDVTAFCRFMESSERLVPVADALMGRGRALTIDDGTVAGARAALMARRYGHAVTLFVNPWQVEDGRAYPFSYLNSLLDETTKLHVCWKGQDFRLDSVAFKERFRAVVKNEYRRDASPEESYTRIGTLQTVLDIDRIDIPEDLRGLNVDDLRELLRAGVDIENHFWSHVDPSALPPVTLAAEFERAKRWLSDRLGLSSKICACPFGEFWPSPEFLSRHETVCLLLDGRFPSGPLAESVVNRMVLEL